MTRPYRFRHIHGRGDHRVLGGSSEACRLGGRLPIHIGCQHLVAGGGEAKRQCAANPTSRLR